VIRGIVPVSDVLALEIMTARGRPKDPSRNRQLFARSGSPTNCGAHHGFMRASQARHRCRTNTVAKYMARGRRPPSQGGRHSFINHDADCISSTTYCVPTIFIPTAYGLLLRPHDRAKSSGCECCAPSAELDFRTNHRGPMWG